jgi:copper chaperone NosL
MRHRNETHSALIAAALLVAACAVRPTGPPVVRWGVDECSSCHMILGDERFAAVARSEWGEEARFDDLGCLLRWSEGRPTGAWKVWVHDAAGHGWLDAETALYSHDVGVATPMGSGVRAWGSREAAVGSGDVVETWQQLGAPHGSEPTPSKP